MNILQRNPHPVLADRYEVLEKLGGGGFGETFKAIDRHLPSRPLVVVKQLKPRQTDSEVLAIAERLFYREAEILDRIGKAHDQIPDLLAYFEQDHEFYLVQEYVEGQTLEQELKDGHRLSQAQVIALLKDVLQVLAFVHQQGIIHRDIKPANLIRRQRDGKIILIDFGAVKEVRKQGSDTNRNTSLTVSIESRGYSPPEQLEGRPCPASDIYAVGMLALHALTGRSPAVLPRDSHREYRCSLLKEYCQINSELAEILEQMTCQDERQRYQTGTSALQALERLIHHSEQDTDISPCTIDPHAPTSSDSPFYIEFPIEAACCQEITKQSGLVRIKAPLDTGKTTLMGRILHHAEQQGYRTVLLSLEVFNEETRLNLTKFLRYFCASISRRCGISPKKIDEYWDDEFFTPHDNCTEFFEKCILSELHEPLVLGLDDLDVIFPDHRIAKEFLKLLRSWHEQSKFNPIWAKLRLILAYSTDVYIVMDTSSSPFNVGLEVALPEFTIDQISELAECHHLSLSSAQIDELVRKTGGHPYLIRVALYYLACHHCSLEQLLQDASTEAGVYSDHLRRHLKTLQKYPELEAAMKAVVQEEQPVRLESELAYKLNGLGLIRRQGNAVVPRCEIYQQYFRDRLFG